MPARRGSEQRYYRKVNLWLLQAVPSQTQNPDMCRLKKNFWLWSLHLTSSSSTHYGRLVTIESDHKRLEAIAKKPLRCAPKRLQGMFLKIQKFDINIVYSPGSRMYLADTLSRAYLPSSKNTQGDFEMVNVLKILPVSAEKHDEVLRHTSKDEVLQLLKEVILTGWPADKESVPAVLNPYYSYRGELSVYDGLIFRGEHLVIPQALCYQTMQQLHSSHIGINGCLRRARECLFWPRRPAPATGRRRCAHETIHTEWEDMGQGNDGKKTG